ncbi:MAG: hypothetical protein ABJA98_09490 [Acidobacteriota bacterium]
MRRNDTGDAAHRSVFDFLAVCVDEHFVAFALKSLYAASYSRGVPGFENVSTVATIPPAAFFWMAAFAAAGIASSVDT